MTTIDVVSIGRLVCDLQASVPRVRRAIQELGIKPVLRLNHVDHMKRNQQTSCMPFSNGNKVVPPVALH